jgi:hypothetical protein
MKVSGQHQAPAALPLRRQPPQTLNRTPGGLHSRSGCSGGRYMTTMLIYCAGDITCNLHIVKKTTHIIRKLVYEWRQRKVPVNVSSPEFRTPHPPWGNSPSGPGPPQYRGLTITLRPTTPRKTPLDERSARSTNLYLGTHNN